MLTSRYETLVLVTCIESHFDMDIKEARFVVKGKFKETNYLVGGEDTSNVLLGLRECVVLVHTKSHIGKIKKC